jgi:hypothetical protein
VKLTRGCDEAVSAHVLVEPIRLAPGVSKQQHRAHVAIKEPASDCAEQESAQAVPMQPPKYVDLVQLPLIAGYSAIVQGTTREPNKAWHIVFDQDGEVVGITLCQNTLPLAEPDGQSWATSMRLLKGPDVEVCQGIDVLWSRLANAIGHHTCRLSNDTAVEPRATGPLAD